MSLRTLLVAFVLALACTVLAPSALAATCRLNAPSATDPGNALFDSQGFEFDTINPDDPTPEVFATLGDGGSNPVDGTPAGPIERVDSWDHWGALFVGGDRDANRYTSNDDNSCSLQDAGRQLAFGDLGSDEDTVVSSSSDGDTALAPADLWGVTSSALGGPVGRDSLAHVWDGAGGADRIDAVTLTGTDAVPQDNLAYRWDNVAIAPGDTVAYLSYEIQQASEANDAAIWNAQARDAARTREAAPPQEIFKGMSDQEIGAVRNWPRPLPSAVIAPVPGVDDSKAATLSAAGSVASSAARICGGAAFAWDFGDGATGSGPTVSHRFASGSHDVRLTVTNSCGTSATASRTIASAHIRPRARLARRLRFARLAGGRTSITLSSRLAGTATVVGTIPPGIARQASAARISRTVLRTNATLGTARPTKVRLKLRRNAVRALRRLHSPFILTLRIKVRDVDHHVAKLTQRTSVRF